MKTLKKINLVFLMLTITSSIAFSQSLNRYPKPLMFLPQSFVTSTDSLNKEVKDTVTVHVLKELKYSVQLISISVETNWPGKTDLLKKYGDLLFERRVKVGDKKYIQYHVLASNLLDAKKIKTEVDVAYHDAFIVYWNKDKRYN